MWEKLGVYYFADGGKYIGEWKNGKSEGTGISIYQPIGKFESVDKDIYDGDWKDGKMHGKGNQT